MMQPTSTLHARHARVSAARRRCPRRIPPSKPRAETRDPAALRRIGRSCAHTLPPNRLPGGRRGWGAQATRVAQRPPRVRRDDQVVDAHLVQQQLSADAAAVLRQGASERGAKAQSSTRQRGFTLAMHNLSSCIFERKSCTRNLTVPPPSPPHEASSSRLSSLCSTQLISRPASTRRTVAHSVPEYPIAAAGGWGVEGRPPIPRVRAS
jgi:hypothetical protein